MSDWPLISLLTFLPVAGAAVLLLAGRGRDELARQIGMGFSVAGLLLALVLWVRFEPGAGMQFVEKHSWIPTIGVDYYVGVDGLGVLMVLLAGIVTPIGMLAAWRIQEKPYLYFALVLLLQAGLFGTFTALNFFHWFLFWEVSLVPAYFLVRLWGGPLRSSAALQFFVYTMVGSIAMLVGFLAVYQAAGSFDFLELAGMARSGELSEGIAGSLVWGGLSPERLGLIIFLGILLGFAVKVPLMPFHTWLPATYAEAPTGTTILLTGAMSKMGLYGILRILIPIFPEQMRMVQTPLLWLAVITIVFSAFAAFAQRDLKRMLAYSSINHLGYCLLGIFAAVKLTGGEAYWVTEKAAALNGVFLQMFNHGLVAAALFCFLGYLEQRSQGLRGLNDFGGLRQVAPVLCGLMGVAMFASLGLPGLNGFVGEFLIFKGVFSLAGWAAVLSATGLLVTAVFLLVFMQRVFHGPLNERWAGMPDLSWKERLVMAPAIGLMLLLGVYPQLVIEKINPTVLQIVAHLTS